MNQPPTRMSLSENFLPPAYVAEVDKMEHVVRQIEPRPHEGISVNDQILNLSLGLAGVIASHRRFTKSESRSVKGDIRNQRDWEKLLQIHAAATVIQDMSLRLAVDVASTLTGDIEAHDPENAPRAYEIGEEIITLRARHAASTLLRAENFVLYEHDFTPGGSVWDRTLATEAKGPAIRDREWRRYDELRQAAIEAPFREPMTDLPFKPSRFTIVNIAKGVRHARAKSREPEQDSTLTSLENFRQVAEAGLAENPEPLPLTQNQITEVMGTTAKICKYINNAGRIDKSIATDPAARYLSFVLAKLSGGQAIRSEILAFERRAKQTAAQLNQFA